MTPATKAALFLADRAGINVPQPVRMLADPIGSLIGAVAPRVNDALGVAPGTVQAVANPKGFLKDLAKDVGKDYLRERNEIPEEDRSFSSSGGGSKAYTDDELTSGTSAYKRGGKVKNTASRRGDGIAQRGKTKGRYL
jgi:hypothetical protein